LQIDLLRIRDETKKTVIFITHSIDEAVFLADRVAVMTARPGVIKQIVTVPISREKRFADDVKSSPEFIRTRQLIWDLLKEEVIKSQEICSKCSVNDCSLTNVKSAEHLVTPLSGIKVPIEVKSR
jgi:NitT/TauT family transport system ATP-binding protein